MAVVNKIIERKRGDTEEIPMNILSVIKPKALPKDVTGHKFVLTVNKELSPQDTKNQLFQIFAEIVDAKKGMIVFKISPENANYVGQFYYDIEMEKPNGTTRTIMEGQYILTQDITKVH